MFKSLKYGWHMFYIRVNCLVFIETFTFMYGQKEVPVCRRSICLSNTNKKCSWMREMMRTWILISDTLKMKL